VGQHKRAGALTRLDPPGTSQRAQRFTHGGTADPELLGDGLFLLIEGALITRQIFPGEGPSTNVAAAAARLIDAALK